MQKFKQKKVRFHRLAVEQGYLKQITVDCFIAHILNTTSSNTIALAKIYEMLNDYANQQQDFREIKLPRAPLMGVSFKSIKLDGANLIKADLTKADLSRSSLVEANLKQANLTKAILTEVNFSKSCLTGANFRDSCLEKANFSSTTSNSVDFRGANLAGVNFAGAQLKDAMLPLHYPYEVYYNRDTQFDRDFDPEFMGWKMIE